jgi:pilus assembly protein CpaB
MNQRTMIIGAGALVSGLSAVAALNSFSPSASAPPTIETQPVVVAAADVPRGVMVTEDMVKVRDYPKDYLPPGTLAKPADAVGRASMTAMVKDEPVLEAKLAPKGSGRGLAALIPEGMRACTIHTPSVSTGVAGFILPGDKVDVLLTLVEMGADDRSGGATTITLLEAVEILAVDQRVDAPAENKVDLALLRSATLLVTPDQAARLNLAQDKGTLHLSLRNPVDKGPAAARSATLSELRYRRESSWEDRFTRWRKALGSLTSSTGQPAVPSMMPMPLALPLPPPPPATPAAPSPPPSLVETPPATPSSPVSLLAKVRTIRGTSESVMTLNRGGPQPPGR